MPLRANSGDRDPARSLLRQSSKDAQEGTMRLVRITHYRCGDYDCASYVMAPADWSSDEIETRVDRAMDAYLAAYEEATKGVEKVSYPHMPRLDHLDAGVTVGEALADFEAKKAAYDEAEAKRRYTARSFENFLTDQGFTSLWSDDAGAVKAEASWGHRHGQRLQYGNTDALERWPSVRKLHALLTGEKAQEYDEEDFA